MALAPGTRIGPYEILNAIGAGGMGEVYRARDTQLGRSVAIKIVPRDLTADPDRLARFRREGRLLASLNHPHIGAIYGFEENGAVGALVLEFVEGRTLAEVIAGPGRRPLGVEEALKIARQIADAIEAAHEQGVIHRDLKPANVMVTPNGVVKVLDFGLARTADTASGNLSETRETMALEGTRAGLILGTAAYMSPEQARGLVVDKRTDIWAFGCVVYEMLTGRTAFSGSTLTDVLAAILERDPDWSALPPETPSALRRLLRRCLEKDPKERLRDIGDARIDLAHGAESAIARAETRKSAFRWSRRGLLAASAGLVGLLVASIAIGYFFRPAPPSGASAAPVRFAVFPPASGAFQREVTTAFFALSPDGSQLAFAASAPGLPLRLWLRPISSLEAKPLAGTEGGRSPFWSPDSRFLAFFAGGKLKRVDVRGGTAVQIADVADTNRSHGTWGSAGTILIGGGDGGDIFSVSASSGTLQSIVTPDRVHGETRVSWPWFLPDGKRFVYLIRTLDGGGRVTLSGGGGAPRTLLSAVSSVQWVDPDFFVFVQDGVLVGQRFDLASERLVGDPFSIAEPVDYHFTVGRAMFTTSRNGMLAYHSHADTSKLIWFDRAGHEIESVDQPGGYQNIRISPDGNTVLFDRMVPGSGSWDLWTRDLTSGGLTHLTSDRGAEVTGVWLTKGNGIVFAADRGGPPHLFRRNLQTGVEDELRPAGLQQMAMAVSPDGATLAYVERAARGGFDMFTLPLANPAASAPLVTSPYSKYDVRFSPDGEVISYVQTDAGTSSVYVAARSATAAAKPVSSGAALLPRWSQDTGELFYVSGANQLMTVRVRTAGSIAIGTAAVLFTIPPSMSWSDFDVSPDGKRFLAVVPQNRPSELPITVLLNWTAEVQPR